MPTRRDASLSTYMIFVLSYLSSSLSFCVFAYLILQRHFSTLAGKEQCYTEEKVKM